MTGTVVLVESVPDAFASLVVERVGASVAGTAGSEGADGFSLFLSGGGTAQECYERLAAVAPSGGPVEWGAVDLFLGDERCVPPDHPDSNHRMIAETLLDHVGAVRSDHPMYRDGTPDDAAAAYQAELAALPALDLVHLGLGPDGHTASLFPRSAALAIDDPDVLVVANQDPLANNPHDRITLTYPGIARARLVVVTVAGAPKRWALAQVVAGGDVPATRVVAAEVIWLVDAEAAGETDLPAG